MCDQLRAGYLSCYGHPHLQSPYIDGLVAQGIGQASLEHVVYDDQSGQTLSGSLMDYTLPRADDLPFIAVELNEIIEADNPVGVKGAGEGQALGNGVRRNKHTKPYPRTNTVCVG